MKNQTEEKLENRALIIEDEESPAYSLCSAVESLGLKSDIVKISDEFLAGTGRNLVDLSKVLPSRKYDFIFMDYDLGEFIDKSNGQYGSDGEELSERIRSGKFGTLNQDTPIVNTSSNHPNRFSSYRANKFGRDITQKFLSEARLLREESK